MDKLLMVGEKPLHGELNISGAKNSALPIIAATLLTDEEVILDNIPDLQDVRSMMQLLNTIGVNINQANSNSYIFQSKNLTSLEAPYNLVRKMRASIAILGPMLARFGEAKISMPGGCAIGARPVDFHIMVMETLGASVTLEDGYIIAKAPKGGLIGNKILMPKVSVMATENAIMAASLAIGVTTIINAAKEPEVIDLGNILNSMGAKISGLGTDKITIMGVKKLHGTKYKIISDRLEAITYAISAIITKGEMIIKNTDPKMYEMPLQLLKKMGANITEGSDFIEIKKTNPNELIGINIETAPFPEFPTDLQAQFMALSCLAKTPSIIREKLFENRFMHVPELIRMGANIKINGDTALIYPIKQFKGAQVMATDLRASAALIIAGLSAYGETTINRLYHIDRGYEKIDEKLKNCGANINRIKE